MVGVVHREASLRGEFETPCLSYGKPRPTTSLSFLFESYTGTLQCFDNETRNHRFVQRLECKIWSEVMTTSNHLSYLYDYQGWFNLHNEKGWWHPHTYGILATCSEQRVIRHVLAPKLQNFRKASFPNVRILLIDTFYSTL